MERRLPAGSIRNHVIHPTNKLPPERAELLAHTGARILDAADAANLRTFRVGIDGVDGAGKTMFADELAEILSVHRHIIRASVDGFHNPRAVRYAKGRHSPEGYFHNSYNYGVLKSVLLDPLSPGGDGTYQSRAFDHRTDSPVDESPAQSPPKSILIFDGIFLHRPELRDYWDFSIFLDVDFSTSIPRCASRDNTSPDLNDPQNQRYIEGQKLYLNECNPKHHATIIINNTDLSSASLVG